MTNFITKYLLDEEKYLSSPASIPSTKITQFIYLEIVKVDSNNISISNFSVDEKQFHLQNHINQNLKFQIIHAIPNKWKGPLIIHIGHLNSVLPQDRNLIMEFIA